MFETFLQSIHSAPVLTNYLSPVAEIMFETFLQSIHSAPLLTNYLSPVAEIMFETEVFAFIKTNKLQKIRLVFTNAKTPVIEHTIGSLRNNNYLIKHK